MFVAYVREWFSVAPHTHTHSTHEWSISHTKYLYYAYIIKWWQRGCREPSVVFFFSYYFLESALTFLYEKQCEAPTMCRTHTHTHAMVADHMPREPLLTNFSVGSACLRWWWLLSLLFLPAFVSAVVRWLCTHQARARTRLATIHNHFNVAYSIIIITYARSARACACEFAYSIVVVIAAIGRISEIILCNSAICWRWRSSCALNDF